MIRLLSFIHFLPLLLIQFSKPSNQIEQLTNWNAMNDFAYIDGNNNRYELSNTNGEAVLAYIPIKPEESSSGTYSGGETKQRKISAAEHEQCMQAIEVVLALKKEHIQDRQMGSGTIIKPQSRSKLPVYIRMNSGAKNRLEETLKNILESEPANPEKLITVKGKIKKEPFVSKKGTATGQYEYYFLPDTSALEMKANVPCFIKLTEGNLTDEALDAFVGKSIVLHGILRQGLWDTDDETKQSRLGDYLVVVEIE
jgi:hypothetical protein